jgi:hypothetical protein
MINLGISSLSRTHVKPAVIKVVTPTAAGFDEERKEHFLLSSKNISPAGNERCRSNPYGGLVAKNIWVVVLSDTECQNPVTSHNHVIQENLVVVEDGCDFRVAIGPERLASGFANGHRVLTHECRISRG